MKMAYTIKVTWTLDDGARNAACIGNDEVVSIEADSARAACREAVECHMDRYEGDWHSGKYGIVAEHLNGPEVDSATPDGVIVE